MGEKVLTTKTGKPLQHPGSGMAYRRYGCRCDECKAFNTSDATRRRNERRKVGATGILPVGVKHGRAAASNWGCKCDVCIEAVRATNEQWHKDHYEHLGRKRGEGVPSSKLKDLEVQAIHERLKLDENASQIAREYSVKPKVIYDLKSGRTWSWLTGSGK